MPKLGARQSGQDYPNPKLWEEDMLKKEDNELLMRVGRGTPMGQMLREYWMPAARSESLVADGAPQRVRLMGENFVAFRGTDGHVGFLYEACPHRGASMAL